MKARDHWFLIVGCCQPGALFAFSLFPVLNSFLLKQITYQPINQRNNTKETNPHKHTQITTVTLKLTSTYQSLRSADFNSYMMNYLAFVVREPYGIKKKKPPTPIPASVRW